jgi:hypothetical protein
MNGKEHRAHLQVDWRIVLLGIYRCFLRGPVGRARSTSDTRGKLRDSAMREMAFFIALVVSLGCLTPSVNARGQDLLRPVRIDKEEVLKASVIKFVKQRRIEQGDRVDQSLLNDVILSHPVLSLDGTSLFFYLSGGNARLQEHEFLCVYDLSGKFISAYQLQVERKVHRYTTAILWRSSSVAILQSLEPSGSTKGPYAELSTASRPTTWEIDRAGGEASPLKTPPDFFATLQQAVAANGSIVRSPTKTIEDWEGSVEIDNTPFLLTNTRGFTHARLLKEGRQGEFANRPPGSVDNSQYPLSSQIFLPWREGKFLEINQYPFVFPERTMRLHAIEENSMRVIKQYDDADFTGIFGKWCSKIEGLHEPARAIPLFAYKKEAPEGYCCVLFDPERGTTKWIGPLDLGAMAAMTGRRTSPTGRYVAFDKGNELILIDTFEDKTSLRSQPQKESIIGILDNGDYFLSTGMEIIRRRGSTGEFVKRVFSLEELVSM